MTFYEVILVDENNNWRMRKGSGERCQNGASSRIALALYNLFQQLNPCAPIWRIVRQYGVVVSVNLTLAYRCPTALCPCAVNALFCASP
jgi:hypothetical protein